MKPELIRLGYYISPVGGSAAPYTVLPGKGLYELVTRGRVKVPGRDLWAGPGWIFFHRPGELTIHESRADEHYECMSALFRVKAAPPDLSGFFVWEEAGAAEDFAREMLFAFHHEGISLRLLGDLIWSQFRLRQAQDQLRRTRTRIPPRIASVMEEISRHPEKAHSVESLAEKVGLSSSHLHAEFKSATGKTPHQLLLQCRMSAARHRLVTTRDPVKAIAGDVGFSNTENFCRAFKKHSGLTAASFRKKYMRYG